MVYIPKKKKKETLSQYYLRLSPSARMNLKNGKKKRKPRSDIGKSHVVRKKRSSPMSAEDLIKWGIYNKISTRADYDIRFRGNDYAPSYHHIINCFGSWNQYRKAIKNPFVSCRRDTNYYDFEKNGEESYFRLCISLGYHGGTKEEYNKIKKANPNGALVSLRRITKQFGSFVIFKNLVLSKLDEESINRFVEESMNRGYRLNEQEAIDVGIDIKGIKNRLGKRIFNKILLRKEASVFRKIGIAINWSVWLRESKNSEASNEK